MAFFRRTEKELAFRRLFDEWYAPLCHWAGRYVRSRGDREDIVQEAFVSLWENCGDAARDLSRDRAVPFLKICVRNACLNRLSRLSVESRFAGMYRDAALAGGAEDEDVLTLEELYGMLLGVLEKLPEQQRAVFFKSFCEGKTREQVARETDFSVKSVGRYRKKVLDMLREYLKNNAFLPLPLVCMAVAPTVL